MRSYRTDRYSYTIVAVFQTLLIAAVMPLAAWAFGWLLAHSSADLESAFGGALQETAKIWLMFRFLRGMLVEKGVGRAHFRWSASNLEIARKELRWFEPLAVSLSFVVSFLDRYSVGDWSDSIGRACFVAVMVALSWSLHRFLRAGSDFWGATPRSDRGLLLKTHRIWSFAATTLPALLALLALAGYYYTALQFELRLRHSILFALALVLVNALLLRWLFMARRHLAVSQVLEAKARREEEAATQELSELGVVIADEEKVDIPAIDAQTRRLFKSSMTLAAFVGLYLIWASVLPALRGLDRVQLYPSWTILAEDVSVGTLEDPPAVSSDASANASSSIGGMNPLRVLESGGGDATDAVADPPVTVTLADVLLALVFVLFTSVAARNLPALLELSLLQRLPLDSGSRYAVATLVRYVILIIGVSAVSSALGVGWEKVQWLAAALTFGLAFGLQEIFANFVSGLIILIERPIRVGDVVSVGAIEGRVTQLRMRATTILDRDLRELLIPNREFITGTVINWTLTDPVTRFVVKVGIAYGSDTELARKLLLQCADDTRLVLDDPPPQAIFLGFGESSLDFELRTFMPNRDLWAELTDRLHTRIDKAFREAGIEIAFPQRDLHVRSGLDVLSRD